MHAEAALRLWFGALAATLAIGLTVGATAAVAQEGSVADPRGVILLATDLEERAGPAEGQFITSAGGLWLPCETSISASSPLMIVNLDERGWLVQQVATVFPDEASASEALTLARDAFATERLAEGCASPEDVLVFDVRTAHDAPVSVGDEMVSATGQGIISGEGGPIEGPMTFHVVRDGPLVTALMVRAVDDRRFADVTNVETAVLESLAARLAEPRVLPDAQATTAWAAAGAPTANAAADLIGPFAQAFDADRASRATRRAAGSLRQAVREHLAWLEDNPLPPVSDAFVAQFEAIDEAVRDLTRCGRPARCNRVIDSAWVPALAAGDTSNRLRDLSSLAFDVATLPEPEPTATPQPTGTVRPSPEATATARATEGEDATPGPRPSPSGDPLAGEGGAPAGTG